MDPYDFLRSHVKADICTALREDSLGEMASVIRGWLGMTGPVQVAPPSDLNSIAETADQGNAVKLAIAHLIRTAFESPDARLRGLAWLELVGRWLCGADDVVVLLSDEIVDRFGWRPNSICTSAASFAEGWIRTLKFSATSIWMLFESGHDVDETLRWTAEQPTNPETWLTDPSPFRRCRALLLILRSGRATRRGLHTICSMVTEDTDTKIRYRAVMTLTALFQRQRDLDVLRLLAQVASDESEAIEVRVWAYRGLYIVDGEQPPSPATLSMEDDLLSANWRYVSSFL